MQRTELFFVYPAVLVGGFVALGGIVGFVVLVTNVVRRLRKSAPGAKSGDGSPVLLSDALQPATLRIRRGYTWTFGSCQSRI